MWHGHKTFKKLRNSARLTDQRSSYAFSGSLFTIHVRHLLPTSDIKRVVTLNSMNDL